MTTTAAPHTANPTRAQPTEVHGIIAEFASVDAVMAAARAVRDAGYRRFDVHSPFPIHGIDQAIGIRPTILPWIVLGGGLLGMAGGIILTVFTMASDITPPGAPSEITGYPYLISGKPFNSFPAWVPVIFELTILFASFAAVLGMLLLNKLPMLYNPLFKSDRFRRATSDRFIVSIDAADPRFDPEQTAAMLRDLDAQAVEIIEP